VPMIAQVQDIGKQILHFCPILPLQLYYVPADYPF
jgi:hypothetical protein